MYRFAKDLDLSHLIGGELTEVTIAPFNLVLRLEPRNHINLEGRWSLFDPNGGVFDEGDQQEPKDAYRVHVLLQKKVTGFDVVDPKTLDLTFEGGWRLRLYDDSDQYESLSISPNIYI